MWMAKSLLTSPVNCDLSAGSAKPFLLERDSISRLEDRSQTVHLCLSSPRPRTTPEVACVSGVTFQPKRQLGSLFLRLGTVGNRTGHEWRAIEIVTWKFTGPYCLLSYMLDVFQKKNCRTRKDDQLPLAVLSPC